MSDDDKNPTIADLRRKLSPEEARESAAEAQGFLASITIHAGGEDFVVPQRSLLDDDQRERMEELELETQSWAREPDVEYPARIIRDEDGNETHYPARSEPGALKLPYQDKDGKLIRPSYPVRVAMALWGEDKYARYKAAGGRASDVTATLQRLDERLARRAQGDGAAPPDPKSVGGNS